MVKRQNIFRRCSDLINYNFYLKIVTQLLYRHLYIRANFETDCSNGGVDKRMKSLRFCM
jgi:hypothetical protein